METTMKADLCVHTLENALTAYPALEGAVIHSDRGTQYTSETYRQAIWENHIHQSMNSAGGRCHDNARCESMWARIKTELLYNRYDTKQMTVEDLKELIWRYFFSYWNNRRICSANGGLPPMIKRACEEKSVIKIFYDNDWGWRLVSELSALALYITALSGHVKSRRKIPPVLLELYGLFR